MNILVEIAEKTKQRVMENKKKKPLEQLLIQKGCHSKGLDNFYFKFLAGAFLVPG